MIFQNFSPKQRQAMLWWAMPESKQYDAIVCDGSVRSGKTMAMSIGFLIWSMRNFDRESFAFCGKTIDSLKRNVIQPLQKWMEGIVQPKINLSKNYMDVQWLGHENRYYFFGGKDESSYTLIQGITLAGVLLDEAALMPQSFVTGKIAVSKDDYQQLTALAKEGITSRSEIQDLKSSVSYYQRQYFNASSAVERLQERYDRLKEKCQPFLQAMEHFPKLVEVFVEKVKELFSIKEAQERKEREDRAAARKEQSKHRRGRNDWER